MICNSCKTLQQCLQQRRRNASLQQLYNKGNSIGMGVIGLVITPTQQLHTLQTALLQHLKSALYLLCICRNKNIIRIGVCKNVCMRFFSYYLKCTLPIESKAGGFFLYSISSFGSDSLPYAFHLCH